VTAIQVARELRAETAGVSLVVDPANEPLMRWYRTLAFGFQRLAPNDPRELRLAMKL